MAWLFIKLGFVSHQETFVKHLRALKYNYLKCKIKVIFPLKFDSHYLELIIFGEDADSH